MRWGAARTVSPVCRWTSGLRTLTSAPGAGEHRDAVHSGVMPKPVAGHADFAAAGLEQGALIEMWPLLNGEIKPSGQVLGPGGQNAHEPFQIRIPVLARLLGVGLSSLFRRPPSRFTPICASTFPIDGI